MKKKQTNSQTEPPDALTQLKLENKKLLKHNEKLRDMLSLIVKTWREQDAKTAEKCFDMCRKATFLFLEIGPSAKDQ